MRNHGPFHRDLDKTNESRFPHLGLLGLPLTRRHHGLLIFAHPAVGRNGHRAVGK